MNFLWNLLSDLTSAIGSGSATKCAFIFFEPEVPKSLREE